MILRIMGIEEDIEFDDYHDTLLMVQDPNFYATLLTKINQISKSIKVNENTIKSRLARARERLKQDLKEGLEYE